MGDVVDLAEHKRSREPPDLAQAHVDEVEHVGTAGGVRVSLAVLPETDPGWVHVVVSQGIGTPARSVFAVPDRMHGINMGRITGKVIVRALRAATFAGSLEPEPYTPDERALHEEIIGAGDTPIDVILAGSPIPDGAA